MFTAPSCAESAPAYKPNRAHYYVSFPLQNGHRKAPDSSSARCASLHLMRIPLLRVSFSSQGSWHLSHVTPCFSVDGDIGSKQEALQQIFSSLEQKAARLGCAEVGASMNRM